MIAKASTSVEVNNWQETQDVEPPFESGFVRYVETQANRRRPNRQYSFRHRIDRLGVLQTSTDGRYRPNALIPLPPRYYVETVLVDSDGEPFPLFEDGTPLMAPTPEPAATPPS